MCKAGVFVNSTPDLLSTAVANGASDLIAQGYLANAVNMPGRQLVLLAFLLV